MQQYEYKVVPAPARGERERGLKAGVDRFAHTLSRLMNDMAAQGWDYLRAETLPAEERQGLTGKSTVYHNLLVFRRAVPAEQAPAAASPVPAPVAVDPVEPKPDTAANDEAAPADTGPLVLRSEAPEGSAPKLRAHRVED